MKRQLSLTQVKDALSRRNPRYDVLSIFDQLKGYLQNNAIPNEYVPVKIVAGFEEFFRECYQKIIDIPDFRKGLKDVKALKNATYDFDILGAFQDSDITLGDYLSYLIPCSKFEDINNTLSALLNIDFAQRIKEVNENAAEILDSVNEIFRMRHIFCHEIQQSEKLDYNKATKLIDDASDFLTTANEVISNTIYPNIQTTQEMQEEANRMLAATEEELGLIVQRIQNEDYYGIFNFDFLDAWKQYRETRAKLYSSSIADDGSMSPIAYTISKESTTRALINELKDNFRFLLRRGSLVE